MEHKDSGCTECNFVQDRETLFVFLVPRELKEEAIFKPMFFGKFNLPGWTGHNSFYLFRCKSCGHVSIDYPHGYTDYGLMFLSCDSCRATLPLEVSEEKDIYEREGGYIPKPTREERVQELNSAIAGVEEKGIRVIISGSNDRTSAKSLNRNVWTVGLVLSAIMTFGIFLVKILNWRPF